MLDQSAQFRQPRQSARLTRRVNPELLMLLFARLVSCLVAARSSARLMPVLAVAGLGLLGACGSTPGGGGGGILYSGGAAGTVCDPATQNQGCLVEAGGFAVMQCTGTAWAKSASCASGEVCVEAVVGGKISASCKAPATTADAGGTTDSQANNDSSGATDAAAAGDTTLVDVNIIGQDGSSPNDSSTGPDAGKDTTTGKDSSTGADSTTGKDILIKADISAQSDKCGNTLCGPEETEESCFIDCFPVAACIWTSCPTEKAACLNNATCKSFVECVGACSDETCQEQCGVTFPEAESFMEDLDACGETEGCTTSNPGTGSCSGACGTSEDQGGCFCDDSCVEYGDCCGDYESECGGGGGTPTGSCQGACGSDMDMGNCYCDTQCVEYQDCCPDYNQFCPAP